MVSVLQSFLPIVGQRQLDSPLSGNNTGMEYESNSIYSGLVPSNGKSGDHRILHVGL